MFKLIAVDHFFSINLYDTQRTPHRSGYPVQYCNRHTDSGMTNYSWRLNSIEPVVDPEAVGEEGKHIYFENDSFEPGWNISHVLFDPNKQDKRG